MQRINVFFVWQSCRSQTTHRRMIRAAAQDACQRITAYRSNDFQAVLDEAAAPAPGMCRLPNSTLRKIAAADILLVDLTWIGKSDEPERDSKTIRPLPDAELLFYLGYFVRVQGVEQIIGVRNIAFGGADDTLLDAKRRWVVDYDLSRGSSDEDTLRRARKSLSRKLEGVMLTVMHRADTESAISDSQGTFRQTREQFEEAIKAGEVAGCDPSLACVALTLVPEAPAELSTDDIQQALSSAAGSPGNVDVGDDSIRMRRGEAAVELFCRGAVRATSTANLNAARAGFPLPPNTSGLIPSSTLERNVILAVHQYCGLLNKLGVSPPWHLGVSLLEIRDFAFVPARGERSDVYDADTLATDPLIVHDPDSVASVESVAQLLKGTFDYIWREFGCGVSRNYDVEGNWNPHVMD